MGLLDGKTALIFGVANDHSIAWGIAQAFHAEGATIGFSSVESLIERRVRPLAESIGSTFIEPCDVQDDEQIKRVFAKWAETHDSLDILVHALAFAKREDLEGDFTIDVTRGIRARPRRLGLLARRPDARGAAAPPRGLVDPDAHLLRGREGRRQLQRHGRRQGRARGVRPLPRRRPRPVGDPGQRDLAPARSGRWRRRASPASRRCTDRSPRPRRCGRTSRPRTSDGRPCSWRSDLSRAVTGEVHLRGRRVQRHGSAGRGLTATSGLSRRRSR